MRQNRKQRFKMVWSKPMAIDIEVLNSNGNIPGPRLKASKAARLGNFNVCSRLSRFKMVNGRPIFRR